MKGILLANLTAAEFVAKKAGCVLVVLPYLSKCIAFKDFRAFFLLFFAFFFSKSIAARNCTEEPNPEFLANRLK